VLAQAKMKEEETAINSSTAIFKVPISGSYNLFLNDSCNSIKNEMKRIWLSATTTHRKKIMHSDINKKYYR